MAPSPAPGRPGRSVATAVKAGQTGPPRIFSVRLSASLDFGTLGMVH